MAGSGAELSLKGRVLLWLAVVAEAGEAGTIAPTQAGISERTGLSRGHVSRTVAPLVTAGMLREERVRVTGFSRTLKAYVVTESGRGELERLRRAVLAARVPVRASEGPVRPRRLGDVLGPEPTAGALWQALESIANHGHLDPGMTSAGGPARLGARFRRDDQDASPRPLCFVGREAELERFREWLAETAGVLVIEAPGGLGKSALVRRAVERGIGNRHLLWIRFTTEMGGERLVERTARFLNDMGRSVAGAAAAGPGVPPALERGLKGLPMLIVLDDLHKGAPSAHDIAAALARIAARLPTFKLVLCGRQVTVPGLRIASSARIRLAPLPAAAAEHFLAERSVPRAARPRLAAAAKGVPLLLSLLADRALVDPDADGAQRLSYERLVADLATGLAPANLKAASWAAAIRTPFAPEVFLAHGLATDSTLDALVTAGLLMRREDGRLEMHDLVREAFYPRLAHSERARVHARLAAAYRPAEPWGGPDGPDLAAGTELTEFLHHLVAAGRRDEAVRWVLRNQSRFIEAAERLFAPQAGGGAKPPSG